MWIDLPHPTVIAHRGDKSHAPENTLSAFKLAAENGADAVEFDAKLSADGHVIIIHDQLVDRTTNGTGRVTALPLQALRNLDAGAWFSEKFSGEKIPTLDEIFELVGKRIYMNIELTNYATPFDDLVTKVVEVVKKHNLQERILFSSFLPLNLQKAGVLLPEVPRGLLTLTGWKGAWGRNFGWRGNYFALHPKLPDVNANLIARVQKAGKRIHVWTVKAEQDMKRMIDLGVDGIISADLELTLRLLERKT